MNLAGLKRLIPVGWTGETRALVDRLADHHAFEASDIQRAEIARRVDAFLAAPRAGGMSASKYDLATGDWKTRAEAAARLSADGAWTPWTVAGSLGSTSPVDDALASAIAIAARETLLPRLSARHETLQGPARAAAALEREGGRRWDEAARPLLAEFAANARANGADRRAAAMQALAAAAHLKGGAMQGAEDAAFLLGAAASSLLRDEEEEPVDGAPSAMEDLARVIASLNDAREDLWDDLDAETARRMGAAAASSAFGIGALARPEARPSVKPRHQAYLPDGILPRLAHLTAAEAASALEEEAADPRLEADRRRRLETVSDALRVHPAAHAVSCAEALGHELPEARTGAFRPGMKTYRAAGRRPIVRAGKGGRTVRCRAVAGADGAVAGYLAYDALSREFAGRPLLAAYALDGGRYGYAFDEERPVIRRGEPEQGFMTAPRRIDI